MRPTSYGNAYDKLPKGSLYFHFDLILRKPFVRLSRDLPKFCPRFYQLLRTNCLRFTYYIQSNILRSNRSSPLRLIHTIQAKKMESSVIDRDLNTYSDCLFREPSAPLQMRPENNPSIRLSIIMLRYR